MPTKIVQYHIRQMPCVHTIKMHQGATPLSVIPTTDSAFIAINTIVDTDAPLTGHTFAIHPSDTPLPDVLLGTYIGSVQTEYTTLHVFDRGEQG